MYKLMGLGSGFNELVLDYSSFQRFNSTNSGNLLFNFAINKIVHLADDKYLWSTSSEAINKNGINLLIPMANNIGPHMDILRQGPKLSGVNVNAVVVGIGAQWPLSGAQEDKVPKGTIEWLEKIASMSSVANISVRGEVTLDFLRKIGLGDSAVALGCPSLLINPKKNLGEIINKKSKHLNSSLPLGVGIAAGNPYLVNLSRLEKFLIELAEQPGSRYIVQHPKQLISIAENFVDGVSDEDIEIVRLHWFSHLTKLEMQNWFRKHSTTYTSIPQWILDCRKFDIMIGTRIHGIQMGIQAETPAVCLYIDSRTKELCETMNIPHYSAIEFQKNPDVDILVNLVKYWDWNAFDRNRLTLARKTHDFMKSNNIEVTSHLKSLL